MSPSSPYDNMLSRLSEPSPWSPTNEATVLEPFTYITGTGGKNFRTRLIEAFNIWLGVPPEQLEIIGRIVQMLHNASLLMDDVEDNSQLRRGVPVAHKIYGVPQTVNSANYVYFLAFQELFVLRDSIRLFRRLAPRSPRRLSRSDPSHPQSIPTQDVGTDASDDHVAISSSSSEISSGLSSSLASPLLSPASLIPSENSIYGPDDLEKVVTEELLNLHRGQGLDIFWRDSLTCPTEEEYVNMVNGKTGGLLRIAIKLMMASSDSEVDYVPLVNLIGVYFQIRDDYMNLQSTEYSGNKGYCEDLTEGKFSFPIVHSVRADTSNRQVLNVLQKRPSTPTTKTYIVNYMRDHTRSFEYTLDVMKNLERQAHEEVARLGGNEMLTKILDTLKVEG